MSRLVYFLKNNKTVVSILLVFLLALKTAMFDQIIKTAVISYFKQSLDFVEITPFFNIVLHYNKGVSFGLFSNIEQANLFFGIIVVCVLLTLWTWFFYNITFFNITPIGLITGGAIGNLVDRITREGVVDFLDFHYQNIHYPAFNFADAAIVFGAVIMLLKGFFPEKNTNSID